MSEPRVKTMDEVRADFVDHVRAMVHYWKREAARDPGVDAVAGVAFSILAAIDGSAVALPAFKLIPRPHPTDRAYHHRLGERWYPDEGDIAGRLHEQFAQQGGRHE